MADTDAISRYRSDVIERSINIEWLISAIICQHYFGKIIRSFMLEVLYDEYFSFALKRRILEKIFPDFDKNQMQNLNRVNTIRNYFAHCNQILIEGSDPTSKSAIKKVPDPRKPNKPIDFDKLHAEYDQIAGPLEEYLANVFNNKGGTIFMAEDFSEF